MEAYLIYIGKAALAAGSFYLLYLLLFQHQKHFVFNRIYLPVSLGISFLIPLITFTTVNYIEAPQTISANSFVYLPEAMEATTPEFVYQWYHYLTAVYLLGILGFMLHLVLGHLKAMSIIRFSRLKELFGVQVNVSPKDVHPFSFFNRIVLSEKTLKNPSLEVIVRHEHIHVKERHTLDILFAEILFLFQWFNPFAWLIKDALRNNLEYLTDDQIAKNNNAEAYQLAMVGLAHKKGVAPFLTALNGSQLKNRIIMMKKKTENKYALLKQLVVLPLLAILIMGLSNKEVKTEFVESKVPCKIIVDGKVIPNSHPAIQTFDFTKGIDSKKIIDALEIENVVATSLDLDKNQPELSIRTSDYEPGSNSHFESMTTKNIILDGNRLSESYFYAIDGEIVSKREFEQKGKSGFENVVFLSGNDAIRKYGEKYKGIVADATSGVANFVVSKDEKVYKNNTENGKVKFVEDEGGNPRTLKFHEYFNSMYQDDNIVIDPADENCPHVEVDGEVVSEKLIIAQSDISNIDANQPPWSEKFYGEEYKLGMIIIKTKNNTSDLVEERSKDDKHNNLSTKKFKVSGKVTDSLGNAIQGASVIIDNTTTGTISDRNGNYEIRVPNDNSVLVFSSLGYEYRKVSADKEKINIVLTSNTIDSKITPHGVAVKYSYLVRGKVTDENGNAISGATVYIKDSTTGTITNEKGEFTIGANKELGALVFLMEGYHSKEITTSGNEELNITLIKDVTSGSSGKVNIKGLNNSDPKGKSKSIKLEMGKKDSPLFVVDGVIADKNIELKPEDIESMSVLKDESAIALYGEKAKNGVVLINTKKSGIKGHNHKLDIAGFGTKNNDKVAVAFGDQKVKPVKLALPLNGKDQPLYYVDGKEVASVEFLAPDNIEKMTVLKNEQAIELYGERAKNGVILIETKAQNKFDVSDKTIIVDGREFNGDINDIDPNDIVSIDVRKNQPDTNIYDGKGPEKDKIIIHTKTKYNTLGIDPLIVIDGVKTTKNFEGLGIDKEDIESISILKDASATELYGKEAAGGVILITTKNGTKEIITNELQLRQFIARRIKYPENARNAGITGTVSVHAKVDKYGELKLEKKSYPDKRIDEVVVTALKPEVKESSEDYKTLYKELEKEAERVIKTIHSIHVDGIKNNTVAFTIKFVLQ